jgi:hypothetical protein
VTTQHDSEHVAQQKTVCVLYSDDKIESNKMGWACSAYGREERHIYRVLKGTPEEKRLGRPKRRWEDNI